MSKILTADLSSGHPNAFVDMVFPPTNMLIDSGDSITDYIESGSRVVVSQQLRSVLEDIGVRADFWPLRTFIDEVEYSERVFYLCKILDRVDCFDYARGECTFHTKPGFTHRIDTISRLAIDEDKAAGHHLFYLDNGAGYILCVSDELAERLVSSALTGMKIIAPEDWSFCC